MSELAAVEDTGSPISEITCAGVRRGDPDLAVLFLVDGNPLDDTNILLNRRKILLVMKDGEFTKLLANTFWGD